MPLPELLAIVCLGSLFVRHDRYPVVLSAATADVRVQDILMLAPTLVAAWRWRDLPRPALIPGAIFGLLLVLITVSAIRSPVGAEAAVSVGKFAEFTIAGFASLAIVTRSRHVIAATAILVGGTLVNAVYAAVVLLSDGGLNALLTDRADGLLGTETYAPAAAATVLWCYARLNSARQDAERTICFVGFAAGILAFTASKSLNGFVCLIAVLAIAPALERRWLKASAIVAACALLVLLSGRASDVTSIASNSWTDASAAAVASDVGPVLPPAQLPADVAAPSYDVYGGSLVHRLALAYLGIKLARDHPLMGYGWLRTSDPAFLTAGPYDLTMLERFPRIDPDLLVSNAPTNLHNGYLQVAAEAGIPAAIALVLLLSWCAARAGREVWSRRIGSPWTVIAGLGWTTILLLYLEANAVFGGSFEAALLGGAIALSTSSRGASGSPLLQGRTTLVIAAAIVCLSVVAAVPFRGDSPPTKPARVAALDTRSKAEIFAPGTRPRPAEALRVSNDRLTVGFSRGALVVGDGRARGEAVQVRMAQLPEAGRVLAQVVQRRADQITIAYRATEGHSAAIYAVVVRGIAGVFLISSRSTAEKAHRLDIEDSEPGDRAYVTDHFRRLPAAQRQVSLRVRAGNPLAVLPVASAIYPVVVPFSPAPVSLQRAVRSAQRRIIIEHAARRNTVTFVGLLAHAAGAGREDASRISELAGAATASCPTAQSLAPYHGPVKKDAKGRPIVHELGCMAYSGADVPRLPLAN